MSPYDQILAIAHQQAEATRDGDLERAIGLLEQRDRLVAASAPPSKADRVTIGMILELDRDLATAMRYRMLAIREQMLTNRNGQHALASYTDRSPRPRVFDLDA